MKIDMCAWEVVCIPTTIACIAISSIAGAHGSWTVVPWFALGIMIAIVGEPHCHLTRRRARFGSTHRESRVGGLMERMFKIKIMPREKFQELTFMISQIGRVNRQGMPPGHCTGEELCVMKAADLVRICSIETLLFKDMEDEIYRGPIGTAYKVINEADVKPGYEKEALA